VQQHASASDEPCVVAGAPSCPKCGAANTYEWSQEERAKTRVQRVYGWRCGECGDFFSELPAQEVDPVIAARHFMRAAEACGERGDAAGRAAHLRDYRSCMDALRERTS
jgi:hypothetical protein